jgi:pimeloyl-ACP methyl ester carboxylesterase
MTWTVTVGATAIVGGLAVSVATTVLARAVIYPKRSRPTHIDEVRAGGDVVLSSTALSRFPGTLGLLYDGELKLAVLKPGTQVLKNPERVVRTLAAPAPLLGGTEGRATGNVFGPEDITGTPPESVAIDGGHQLQPAWLYRGAGAAKSIWVIHVHGMLAGRDSALRSAHAVASAGVTSLVVSYRGDGEAPTETAGPSHLGQTEWNDVDAAVAFAQVNGATSVILVGWSLGATLALTAVEQGHSRALVSGLVLVSPVISWAQSIRFGMRQNRVPAWLASLTIAALSLPGTSTLLGLTQPLELPDVLPTVSVPTLIIHSEGDRTAPFQTSRDFAALDEAVELDEFPACPHAMEWNTDPARFSAAVQRWIAKRGVHD